MKPQLAKDAPTNSDGTLKIEFPVIGQAKYDGIRCCIVDGKALSRSLKEIPNREIFELLSHPALEGLDGELIVGDPLDERCFNTTTSYVMSRDKSGQDWTYYVFDKWNMGDSSFMARRSAVNSFSFFPNIQAVPGVLLTNLDELTAYEAQCLAEGHEGIIVRNPHKPYKFGRSGSTASGEALKVKRFTDGEAVVLDAFERMHNANEAKTNALGRTERSTHKANKIGRGDLGGFIVEEVINGERTGRVFKVGTGFNDEQRKDFWIGWAHRSYEGQIIRFKHFEVGAKDLPRLPVFQGFRDERDM